MSSLEITAVRIIPFDTRGTGGRTLAVAEVEFQGALVIRGIRILESERGGLFLGMPSVRGRDGRFRDQVILSEPELARELRQRVLEAYRQSS